MISLPVVFAHPLMEPGGLPVPPAVVATLAVAVMLIAARLGTRGRRRPVGVDASPIDRPAGAPLALWVPARLVGVTLLVVAIAAGRLRNAPLPATLVVSTAWPMLLLASGALGQLWRWVNPFDSLGRMLERPVREASVDAVAAEVRERVRVATARGDVAGSALEAGSTGNDGSAEQTGPGAIQAEAGEHPQAGLAADAEPPVLWAVLPAFGWMYFLYVSGVTFHPQSVAVALANYTLLVLGGCLLLGRRRWLSRFEVFGLLFSWVGRIRRGGLLLWEPPKGADVVLGVLVGGIVFGSLRASTLWPLLPDSPLLRWHPLIGLVLCAGLGVALASLTGRWAARLGSRGSVSAAMVPMVASIGIAASMAGSRLLVGVQMLPRLLTDPFNLGWDPIGAATWRANPQLGEEGLALLQVLVLVAGAVIGVRIARRRVASRRAAEPAMAALGVALALAVVALTAV